MHLTSLARCACPVCSPRLSSRGTRVTVPNPLLSYTNFLSDLFHVIPPALPAFWVGTRLTFSIGPSPKRRTRVQLPTQLCCLHSGRLQISLFKTPDYPLTSCLSTAELVAHARRPSAGLSSVLPSRQTIWLALLLEYGTAGVWPMTAALTAPNWHLLLAVLLPSPCGQVGRCPGPGATGSGLRRPSATASKLRPSFSWPLRVQLKPLQRS